MDHKKGGSAEETFTMMECGNLDMNFSIKYGILLLGNTKAGKTTSAHYLTNQTLKGGWNAAKSIVYNVEDGDELFKNAKIGDNESISETQIPNFFTFKEGQETGYLIDCPGYLDSYGCYRIISNRFFHYQVFSKVENVKFLLTFHYNDMNKTAEMLKKTFKEFISGFDNIESIKDKIFNATSVMVTGVPRNLQDKYDKQQVEEWKNSGKDGLVECVREKFSSAPTSIGENEQILIELKQFILKSNRLFIFEEAVKDQVCKKNNNILKKIGELSKYWEREKVSINVPKFSGFDPETKEKENENSTKNKQIEMDSINISIASYITENTKDFEAELKCLKEYYEKMVLSQFEGLKEVIESILIDIEAKEETTKEEPKSFLIEKIRSLSAKDKEENPICISLNKAYDKKRKEVKEKLFETFDLFDKDGSKKSVSSSSRNKSSVTSSEIPFWVCEIKTMQNIEQISALSTDSKLIAEGNDKLDYMSFILKKLLDLIYNLCTLKKLKDDKEDKAKNALALDYVYKIYKNVDISNKLNKLIKRSTSKSEKTPADEKDKNDNVSKLSSGMFFILIDYPSKLNKVFNRSKLLIEVLISNLNKIDTLKLTSNAAEVVSKFFSEYLKKLERQGDEPKEFESSLEEIKKILEGKIVGLRGKSFEAKNISKMALKEMEEYRLEVMDKIGTNRQVVELILEHNKILQLIAQKLDDSGQYKLAIDIYEALQDPRSCMLVLEKRLKKARENKYEEIFHALMDFAKKANNFYMKEQAREKSYEALSLAQKNADESRLREVKEFIYENLVKPTSTTLADDKVPLFKKFLTEEHFPALISRELSAEIINKSKK